VIWIGEEACLDKTLVDHKIGRAAATAEAVPLDREALNAALRGASRP
jgi:hypothetical protein